MKVGTKAFRLVLVTVLIILAVFVSALFVRANETDKAGASVSSATLTSDETEYVTIVKDGKTDYGVIYSVTDGSAINSTIAANIAYHMNSLGASVSARPSTVPGNDKYFIIVGVSQNHSATAELMSEIEAAHEDGTIATAENGTPLVVTGLTVPVKNGSDDNASNLIEYIGKTNYAFSWQDTTAADKCGIILIDDIKVISGPYILKSYTKDSADILYEGLNDITLPEDAPLLYDRENGTDLPQNVPTDSELITFDGWYSDPELTKPIERIPAGAIGPVSVYAKWVYYTERNDAIIYNGIELGDLPAGSAYYSAKDEATPLPKVGFIVGDKALEGWYSDEALTKRITEVPAGVDSQYTVYAGWVPVLRVDFDDCTLNSYNKTGSAVNNGAYKNLSFSLSNKVGAGYIATEDANGGKYLVWVKGNSDDYNALTDEEKATTWVDSKGVPAYDPQWQKNGKLHEFLGESTSFTFSVDLAKNAVSTDGEEVTYDSLYNSVVLMRASGTDNFSLFATDADGNVYLGSYSGGIKIGELGGEFTRFTVSFDFATGMLRAHNADGSVMTDAAGNAIEKLISVPQKALEGWSEDREMTMLDWLYTLNTYYFVWRSEGSARGSMRIDNFDMRAGIPFVESTEIQ